MKNICCLLLWLTCVFDALAQPTGNDDGPGARKKVTLSSGIESNLLQFAQVSSGTLSYKTIPRYTYFFNTGIDINFHVHKNMVLYTGFQLKNLGIITAINDSVRFKERVYTFGAPAGFKFHTRDNKLIVKAGADIALALNYKIKHFLNEEKIFKKNEFFSNQANLMFASVFAGISYRGIALTGNYYLTNFYNPSTSPANGKLWTLGLGIAFDEDLLKPENSKREQRKIR